MTNRAQDWLRQAVCDLDHAEDSRHTVDSGTATMICHSGDPRLIRTPFVSSTQNANTVVAWGAAGRIAKVAADGSVVRESCCVSFYGAKLVRSSHRDLAP